MAPSDADSDVLVIGGGPAGLSAALYLARYLRSVRLFDAGAGRSSFSQRNRNYLGFPSGIGVQELRARALEQLAPYDSVTVTSSRIDAVAAERDGGFTARSDRARHTARAVVLATGVSDHYPRFDGWEDYVGVTMHWCLTCDAYEGRGQRLVVVGNDRNAGVEALQLRRYTDDVALLTNAHEPEIPDDVRAHLSDYGIGLVEGRIAAVDGEHGHFRTVTTDQGDVLQLDRMFVSQGATPRTELAEGLGVKLADTGWIVVDAEQRTNVPFVYAAGDVTRLHSHQVSTAVHEGGQAASALNFDLYPDALRC